MNRCLWTKFSYLTVIIILWNNGCCGVPYQDSHSEDIQLSDQFHELGSLDELASENEAEPGLFLHQANASETNFNFDHLLEVEKSLRQKLTKKLIWHEEFLVPTPRSDCSFDNDCDFGMECRNQVCDCADGLCLTYQYDPTKFIPRYIYSCGPCGDLGSECKNDLSCNPPGRCHVDSFCHCLYGEHEGPDICVITDVKRLLVVLLGSFAVFGILGMSVLAYTCFLNYRRTGTFLWCLEYRRRRRNVPLRVNPVNGLQKTPAFTIGNLYQFGAVTPNHDESSTSHHGSISSNPMPSTSSITEFDSQTTRKRSEVLIISSDQQSTVTEPN